jgi:hypothetical protein
MIALSGHVSLEFAQKECGRHPINSAKRDKPGYGGRIHAITAQLNPRLAQRLLLVPGARCAYPDGDHWVMPALPAHRVVIITFGDCGHGSDRSPA